MFLFEVDLQNIRKNLNYLYNTGNMRIVDVFDAAREGTFEDFKKHYKKVDEIDKYTGMNLLCLAVCRDKNWKEKLKIIEFLLSQKIDVNFVSTKDKRNALHFLYFCNFRPEVEYLIKATDLLIKNGIEINARDKYGAIPMKYLISVNKLTTQDLKPVFEFLIKHGADYSQKDNFDNSCLDYAKQFSWRNDFIELVENLKI